ncbi:hypothetical protein [Psychrobacter lutiphocae]|uniref:hypothetical protein n=1 Tax=Psychrobacter lutiphocae TaxID=540500 RepID=UPI00037D22D1|nr:hypothetical protein [Psychrobacter lutiphocae]
MKRIHIFKTGTHTDSHGQTVNFSESDLAAAVTAYNPDIHQAPIVVGHPKTDAPAFGWVQSLSSEGGNLYATPEQVNTEFSEQVKAGSYKKVSASFYPPNSPANPVKGVYYLRHVGFLGAKPPAIKGLQPVEFSESGDEVTLTLDFKENPSPTLPLEKEGNKNLFEQMVSSIRTLLFGESATATVTSAQTDIQNKPEQKDDDMTTPAPAAPATPPVPPVTPAPHATPDTTEKDAEIARLKAELDAKKQAEAKAKADALTKENADFAESLVNDGKIAPADKALVTAILDGLDAADTAKPIEFGEGDDKQPLKQVVKDKLASANADSFAYLFSEAAGKPAESSTTNFEAPTGTTIDADRLALHNQALAYSEAHKVDYATAVVAIGG